MALLLHFSAVCRAFGSSAIESAMDGALRDGRNTTCALSDSDVGTSLYKDTFCADFSRSRDWTHLLALILSISLLIEHHSLAGGNQL